MNLSDTLPYLDDLKNKLWRLTHLYYITDKQGQEVLFNLNWAQQELFKKNWHQMLVLKARQLGVTTFFAISYLDDCYWYPNTSAGILAHRKEDAESIFKSKVKYAYDRMPDWTGFYNSATNDRVGELSFANGSSFRVSTGFRSGTYQRLLVSEFGKICSQSPDVAKEIVTGSLNTVSSDQIIAIESTAEGREGYFYNFAKEAEALSLSGANLSPMQMRFFFFPWYDEPSYRETSKDIIVSKETNEYLDYIETERKRKIDEEQRRWYEMKQKMLGDAMKQEYPSTPQEAFESANEGLYYGAQLSKLRANGSVCIVPYDDAIPVHTAWDIGLDDFTSIWCFQVGRGGEVRVINYYENWDEGAAHYCDWLNRQKYRFGRHILPHDARKRDIGSKTQYIDYLRPLLDGNFVVLDIKECDKLEGIQTVRATLSRCIFDNEKTRQGLRHLEAYKKVWDDRLGCYKNTPLHDEHSHACFIGSTLIKTTRGDIPIAEVTTNDYVITPNGSKKVLNKFVRNTKTLNKISYDGYEVTCTPEHEFFCERGLIYADALRYNEHLYLFKDKEVCHAKYGLKFCKHDIGFKETFLYQRMKNQSCLTGTNTDGTEIIIERPSQKQGPFQPFIGPYGQNIMVIFRQVFTFITRMATRETMIYQTCSLYQPPNTIFYTAMMKHEKQNQENQSRLQCNMLKNGMQAKKEKSGIGNTQNNKVLERMNFPWCARNAARSFWERFITKDYAQMPVKQDKDICLESIMKTAFVKCAGKFSWLISMFSRKPVVEIVPLNLREPQEVYDIEVERDHCYYANGFLVSNSDAFRYLAVGLRGLERKDTSSAENDIKAVNRYFNN